ncbi:MAG: hypothetical protein NVSMB32_10030 [Actinomycetota bacterium]
MSPHSRVRAASLLVLLVLGLGGAQPFAAAQTGGTPAPPRASHPAATTPTGSATLIPGGPPPGVRNPLQGVLAGAAIVVTALAGVVIYRTIRNGL